MIVFLQQVKKCSPVYVSFFIVYINVPCLVTVNNYV